MTPSLAILAAAGFVSAAVADWPQWGGPDRNFVAPAAQVCDAWPDPGPKVLWSRELGGGHSGIVSGAGRLFTMTRRGDQDVVVAFDSASGATLWETAYDAPMKPGMALEFGPGPHATPLLVGERLFTLSAVVQLHCFDASNGAVLWSKDLNAEHGVSPLNRGYGASPIAFGDTIIVNGGPNSSGMALRQSDGSLVWSGPGAPPGYSSPILVPVDGEPHLVGVLGPQRIGLNPQSGEQLWRLEVDRQLGAALSSPVPLSGGRFFCSAAYGGGSQLFQVKRSADGWSAEALWHSSGAKCHHGSMVEVDGHVVLSSGDFGPAFMMAVSLADGSIAWRQRGFAKANLVLAGSTLILLDETGDLALATVSGTGMTVRCRAKVLEEKAWTSPTLDNGCLYLRDYRQIRALDLSPQPS